MKTAQQYYQILEDSFLAFRLPPWTTSVRHRMVAHARYYFFDPGVVNALTHQLSGALDPITRGRRFEQFIIQQTRAVIEYARKDWQLSFWRTHSGLEVDLIITEGKRILAAIEIKSTPAVDSSHMQGLSVFSAQHKNVPTFIVTTGERERLTENGVRIVPWSIFLNQVLPKF